MNTGWVTLGMLRQVILLRIDSGETKEGGIGGTSDVAQVSKNLSTNQVVSVSGDLKGCETLFDRGRRSAALLSLGGAK